MPGRTGWSGESLKQQDDASSSLSSCRAGLMNRCGAVGRRRALSFGARFSAVLCV